jgi:acetyltransferase-like isoleucine patch superfamily enzyme
MNLFDENTDSSLRHQILTYHLGELLTDRERARLLGLPEGCRIRERAKILCPEKLVCGKNVWIGEGAVLDAQGGLTIGDYTQIGLNVMVWTHSSHQQALLSQTCTSKEGIVYLPTTIGSNCFIAGPSVIAAGVTIGDRAVIAPLSFVDKNVADDGIVSPHREVRLLQRKAHALEVKMRAVVDLLLRQASAPSATAEYIEQLRELAGRCADDAQ